MGQDNGEEDCAAFYATALSISTLRSPRIWETEIQLSPEVICSYKKMADQLSGKIYSAIHDALCVSKRGLFSFHVNWRFTGTDGWYMIPLLHAGDADNIREACGATALPLSLQCHSCPLLSVQQDVHVLCTRQKGSPAGETKGGPSQTTVAQLGKSWTVWKALQVVSLRKV